MRSYLALFTLIAACMGFGALMPAPVTAKAPVPIVDGFVVEGFRGWQKVTSGLSPGMKYMHKPRSGPHMGSAL